MIADRKDERHQRATNNFAKFVLWCERSEHHKTNPTPKMATPYLALPTHHPIENIYEKNRKIDQAETKNETQIF